MSNYFTNNTVTSWTGITTSYNTDVSLLVASGNKTFTDNFVGFPSCVTTNNSWEQPSPLGYQIGNTDIANSVKATYSEFTTTTTSDIYVPPWCNTLKMLIIAGGGGGGSGGANNNNVSAGAGGSGAGGTLAIMTTKTGLSASRYSYRFNFDSGGSGGAYQGSSGAYGYAGAKGVSVTLEVGDPQLAGNADVTIHGGGGGGRGMGTSPNNTASDGGTNTNNGTVNTSGEANISRYLNLASITGNNGSGGSDHFIGNAGTVQNNLASPIINSNNNQPPQGNNTSIDNANQKPGIGQGGVGGWNSNNNNGYQGQNGGPALVRVYFLK